MKGNEIQKFQNRYHIIMDNLENNPRCIHGPKIKFKHRTGIKEFYVCAAFRDKKQCNKLAQKYGNSNKSCFKLGPFQYRKEFLLNKKKTNQLMYCHTCNRLISECNSLDHTHHNLEPITDRNILNTPTKLLRPLEDNKYLAQYFFSENTLNFLLDSIKNLEIKHLISIGTPSIFESVWKRKDIRSILMDIDMRFGLFFGNNFTWFNMFNQHFINCDKDPESKFNRENYEKFLNGINSGNILIIIDPPFGGRVEMFIETLKMITYNMRQHNIYLNVYYFIIYPYFNEAHILKSLPQSHMLDYRVHYTNHKDLVQHKNESYVRIFTNASPKLFKLPNEDGYKICKKCNKFVHITNRHCNICKNCTTKVGATYHHCNICNRCVKSTYNHCNKCNRCSNDHNKCK